MYYECKCTFEMINKNNLQKNKTSIAGTANEAWPE